MRREDLVTEEKLKERERREGLAGYEYLMPDEQVLAMIEEIRFLRILLETSGVKRCPCGGGGCVRCRPTPKQSPSAEPA